MARQPFLVLCLLLLVGLEGSRLQAGVPHGAKGQSGRPNTWSARSSTGRTLAGTWTAVTDPATGAVTGTWTLVDAQGRTLANGGWSASKSPDGWVGLWRAANFGGTEHEFAGSWRSTVDLKATAGFADLFLEAVRSLVSGSWRMGNHSGAWSIRVFK